MGKLSLSLKVPQDPAWFHYNDHFKKQNKTEKMHTHTHIYTMHTYTHAYTYAHNNTCTQMWAHTHSHLHAHASLLPHPFYFSSVYYFIS